MTRVIGLDIGGTKIAGGILRFPGMQRGSARIIPTGAARGGRAVLDDVLKLARELAVEARGSVSAIGLGICELVDRSGRIGSANAIQWLELPILEEISAIAPAVLEADVRAAALAEASLGAGRPFNSFLYVTIGTGISCCLVLDGQPFLGARGLTGTMASSPLTVPCERCGHLSGRTLEELASGAGLAARFPAEDDSTIATAQQVLSAARAGDPRAQDVVTSAAQALGSQLGLLVNALDPGAVIIGGGLGLGEDFYWDQFTASARRHIWSSLNRDLPILRAATGADAGWIGSAICAARRFQVNGCVTINDAP